MTEIPSTNTETLHVQNFPDLAMTLTFDLWPWKLLQPRPFTWPIFAPRVHSNFCTKWRDSMRIMWNMC